EEDHAMDLFTRNDLRTLLANHPTPCVSLLMPTTRGPGNEDKVRWKNLVRQAEEPLRAKGLRSPDARDLLRPLRDLEEDVPFWLNASAGLAAFVAPDFERTFRLPAAFDEQVIVGDRFHVKPLLPLLNDGRFFILALSQKHVRLLLATRQTVDEL